jgi:hypothetical protein
MARVPISLAQQQQLLGWLRERAAGRYVHGVREQELFVMAATYVENCPPPVPATLPAPPEGGEEPGADDEGGAT